MVMQRARVVVGLWVAEICLNVCASDSTGTLVYLFSLVDLIFILNVHPLYWFVRGKPQLNLLLT